MISVRFRDRRSALEAVRTIQGDVFPAFLTFLGVDEPGRFSVVEIAETTVPGRGQKVRSRISRLSDRQWTKVVQRTLDVTSGEGPGGLATVTLYAGEPFDNTEAADELPPGFPKSSLKGVAPGPVQIAATLTAEDPLTIVTIRQVRGPLPSTTIEQWWPLAVTALELIAEHPDFEMATVRAADSDPDAFDPDPNHAPVILVCGPAAAEEQRAALAASATSTIGTDPLVGMCFEVTG